MVRQDHEQEGSDRAGENCESDPTAKLRIRLRQAEHVNRRIGTVEKIERNWCNGG